MKKLLFALLIFFSCFNYFSANAAYVDSAMVASQNSISTEKQFPTNAEIEQMIGRKLSLKEKIAILINKKELKQQFKNGQLDERANKDAKLGFWLSIAGIFFLYALIPGYIFSQKALKKEKQNPGSLTPSNLRLAEVGKGICVVIGILMVLALIFLIAFIAQLGRR